MDFPSSDSKSKGMKLDPYNRMEFTTDMRSLRFPDLSPPMLAISLDSWGPCSPIQMLICLMN